MADFKSETGCCVRFDPKPWDEKEMRWDNKLFMKDRVCCFMHIPLNFGGVMKRCMEKLAKANAGELAGSIVLAEHTSRWGMDVYVEVKGAVAGADNAGISGNFLAKVFEGPYKNEPAWRKEMSRWVSGKGKDIKRELVYYTTCPKCAKHYGKNYVVLLAEV